MTSPYADLPPDRFWQTGVSRGDPLAGAGLYHKRFPIHPSDRIATAGSCFAQHIGRALRQRSFTIIDAEQGEPVVGPSTAVKYGYGIFSARYGNIYTARQLYQLACEAFGLFQPANAVWRKGERFYDAMRPSVEPAGLASEKWVKRHRERHLIRVREVFESAKLFIFTFGLTEAWIDRKTGTVYPTAPGTIAGEFDPEIYAFKNFTHSEVLADFKAFRELLKIHNPSIKFLITVSPVPLTATATDLHVLLATTYSKSILRAVAGELYAEFDDIDYFPAYEMVASPVSRGSLYSHDLRSVSGAGVEIIMNAFFAEHQPAADKGSESRLSRAAIVDRDGPEAAVVCEDILLEAFAR